MTVREAIRNELPFFLVTVVCLGLSLLTVALLGALLGLAVWLARLFGMDGCPGA